MDGSVYQRKEFIVLTAIDLLHENGIYGISTKEIARRLDISESLIFKVFPKKNDIMIAVLEHFCRYDRDIYRTATQKNENLIDGLLYVLNHLLVYYENYPAITSVYQIIASAKGVQGIEEKVIEILQDRAEHMEQLVKSAQTAGILDKSYDPTAIAEILLHILQGTCITWRLMDYSFPLRERTMYSIRLFLSQITEIPK